jgi:hypothetical protein
MSSNISKYEKGTKLISKHTGNPATITGCETNVEYGLIEKKYIIKNLSSGWYAEVTEQEIDEFFVVKNQIFDMNIKVKEWYNNHVNYPGILGPASPCSIPLILDLSSFHTIKKKYIKLDIKF